MKAFSIQSDAAFTISAVIPTYNRAHCIWRALESVLAQTYPAHEIIVVDDGSTDNTKHVLSRFVLEHPEVCVRCLYQPWQGVSASRNAGIAAAAGNWIAFLDSDDCWCAQKLEWQVNALRRLGPAYGLCFTDAIHVNNPEGKRSAFQAAGVSYRREMGILPHASKVIAGGLHGIHIPTAIIRKDVACQIGGFDPKLQIYEDNDFIFRASLATGTCFVNKPLARFERTRGRPEGLTELFANEEFRLQQSEYEQKKWLASADSVSLHLRNIVRHRLQHTFAAWGSYYAARGEGKRACHAIREGLRYYLAPRSVIKLLLIKCFPRMMEEWIRSRYEKRLSAMFAGFRTPGIHGSTRSLLWPPSNRPESVQR